ncbi:Protein TALPID3 [Trichoplax sp. H2]|nr:Protein TALPID3 [Trichoplax sp. H2]|eukprot:RDD44942.1 Protein TALPID3 [Trichoplax sp. H2]
MTAVDRLTVNDTAFNSNQEYNLPYASEILNVTGAAANAVISGLKLTADDAVDDNLESFSHHSRHNDIDDGLTTEDEDALESVQKKSANDTKSKDTHADNYLRQDRNSYASRHPINTIKSSNRSIQQGEHDTTIEIGKFEDKLVTRSFKLSDREQKLKSTFIHRQVSQGNRNKPIKRVFQPKLIKNKINDDFQQTSQQSKEPNIASTAAAAAAAAAVAVANTSPILKVQETLENKLNELINRLQVIDNNINKSDSYRSEQNLLQTQNKLQEQVHSLVNQLEGLEQQRDVDRKSKSVLEKGHPVSTSKLLPSPTDNDGNAIAPNDNVQSQSLHYNNNRLNVTRDVMANTVRSDIKNSNNNQYALAKFVGPRTNPPKPIEKNHSKQARKKENHERGKLLAEILSSESSPSSVHDENRLGSQLSKKSIPSTKIKSNKSKNSVSVNIGNYGETKPLNSYMLPHSQSSNRKEDILMEVSNRQIWNGIGKAEDDLKEILSTSNIIDNNLEIVSQVSRYRNSIFSKVENMKTFQDISTQRIKMEVSNRIENITGEIEPEIVAALTKVVIPQNESNSTGRKIDETKKIDTVKGHRRFLKGKKESNKKVENDFAVHKSKKGKVNNSINGDKTSLKERMQSRIGLEKGLHRRTSNDTSKFSMGGNYYKVEPRRQRIDCLPNYESKVIPLGYPIISNSVTVEDTHKPMKDSQDLNNLKSRENNSAQSVNLCKDENIKENVDIHVEERKSPQVEEQVIDHPVNKDRKAELQTVSHEDKPSSFSSETEEEIPIRNGNSDKNLVMSLSLQGARLQPKNKSPSYNAEPRNRYISDKYFGETNILESEQQLQIMIRNNIVDWVEQELIARIVSEAGNIRNISNVDVESSNEADESSSKSSEADLLNQMGSRGLQLLIDAGSSINHEAVENLVSEVLTDKLRDQMAGAQVEDESEHNLILDKTVLTPQPTPPESDSDHEFNVIEAPNVYTPPKSNASSSTSSDLEQGLDTIVKNEDNAYDERSIDSENLTENNPQKDIEDSKFQKPDLDTPILSPSATPPPSEIEMVPPVTPTPSESDKGSVNIAMEDLSLTSESSQSDDDLNQTVIASHKYGGTTRIYDEDEEYNSQHQVYTSVSEKQMIEGIDKSAVIAPRPISYFSTSAEIANDDELSVIQELQHSELSNTEVEKVVDEGKVSPKTMSESSSIVTTNDTYGDGISEGELLTNESTAYVESRSEGEFVHKNKIQKDARPHYEAAINSRRLIEAILDDELPTESASSDTVMDNTLSEVNPLPDDDGSCSSEGEISPGARQVKVSSIDQVEFDNDGSEGQLSVGQVNIEKINPTLTKGDVAKSSNRNYPDHIDDGNVESTAIGGIRYVTPISATTEIPATDIRPKLPDKLETEILDCHSSSPSELEPLGAIAAGTDGMEFVTEEEDKDQSRVFMRSEEIYDNDKEEADISVLSMDDIDSISG